MRWIERLDEAPTDLGQAVLWVVPPEAVDPAGAHATPEDLADAAPLGPERGAARLARRRLLRALAARVLAVEPHTLGFERSRVGSVRLTSPTCAYASVAGRDGWAMVAIGPRPLGVDLEAAEPEPSLPLDLLHPDERDRLTRLGAAERGAAFARLWVVKEAYAKASGVALETVLKSLEPTRQSFAAEVRRCAEMFAAAVEQARSAPAAAARSGSLG